LDAGNERCESSIFKITTGVRPARGEIPPPHGVEQSIDFARVSFHLRLVRFVVDIYALLLFLSRNKSVASVLSP
jgi:hypothetical protein